MRSEHRCARRVASMPRARAGDAERASEAHTDAPLPSPTLSGGTPPPQARSSLGLPAGQAGSSLIPPRAQDYDFSDLYAAHAPVNTIASGQDYGRLSVLRQRELEVDVSTLEKLALAKARCHYVTVKVVASGQATARRRLHGHTIVFPQKASYEGCGSFDEAVLQAALGQLRGDCCGQLQDAALTDIPICAPLVDTASADFLKLWSP